MPDPSKLTLDDARRIFGKYPVDTRCHYQPGAPFEVRYIAVSRWVPDGSKVLDVGCNAGGMGKRLIAEKGCTVHGVEPNSEYARGAIVAGYSEVWVGLVEDVTLPENEYDVVICMGPMEHAIDMDVAMAAMLKPLKPGGIFCGDACHARGRWDARTHDNVMRTWGNKEISDYLSRWLDDVEVYDGCAEGRTIPDFIFHKGRKRG